MPGRRLNYAVVALFAEETLGEEANTVLPSFLLVLDFEYQDSCSLVIYLFWNFNLKILVFGSLFFFVIDVISFLVWELGFWVYALCCS